MQNQKIKEALGKRLLKLQAESAAVQTVIAKTNQMEYENLAAIYLWWRAAVALPGYLEEAYKPTMVRRVFGENTGEMSFRRLLYLMYGLYGVDKDSLDRKNRALLGLHAEYEKNHELYAKDGVNKLAGFIKSRGGITSLISGHASGAASKGSDAQKSHPTEVLTAQAPMSAAHGQGATDDNELSASVWVSPQNNPRAYRPQPAPKITEGMRLAALSDEAKTYFTSQPSTKAVSIDPPIATDQQGYALAMVKRTGQGYEIIGATEDMLDFREVIVSAYSKRLDAAPFSVRCFLELLKTQTLPGQLLKLYDKLLETSTEKHADNSKRKVTRQVAYLSQENTLLLSPTFATSGVVSVAKLHKPPFSGQPRDCFMPARSIRLLERRLLAANDFHMYRPKDAEQVQSYHYPELCSHILRLENKACAADFMHVEFWPYEHSNHGENLQLTFAPSHASLQKAARMSLSLSDFKKLTYDHVRPWLLSYGEHMTC